MREGQRYSPYCLSNRRFPERSADSATKPFPCVDQYGKGQKKFCGSKKPNPKSHAGTVCPQDKRNHPGNQNNESSLLKMTQQCGYVWRCGKIHDRRSFFEAVCRTLSASFMSFRDSFPASMRCDMIGWELPPIRSRRSSINRRCAPSREIDAAKISKFDTRLTRCTASLPSMR